LVLIAVWIIAVFVPLQKIFFANRQFRCILTPEFGATMIAQLQAHKQTTKLL
jgi:hypothetical protein